MNSAKPIKASPPKRLVFDRRYGWVFDELKDPSEEALAGGRGMFCILPLAKAVIEIASQSLGLRTCPALIGVVLGAFWILWKVDLKSWLSNIWDMAIVMIMISAPGFSLNLINLAAGSLATVIKHPDRFSTEVLKTKLCDEFQKMKYTVQRPNLNLLTIRGNSSVLSVSSLEDVHQESN